VPRIPVKYVSVYELGQQMAKRHAAQPTDKVAGLFYLLRTTQLPTYDAGISAGDAWARCFHVLPFERKIEILFDFPYVGDSSSFGGPSYSTSHECQWFPTWRQLMAWPDRDLKYSTPWRHGHRIRHTYSLPRNSSTCLCPTFGPYLMSIFANQMNRMNMKSILEQSLSASTTRMCVKTRLKCLRPSDIPLSPLSRSTPITGLCESLGKRHEEYTTSDGAIKTAEIESLIKLGVLRTDSCSELVLGIGKRNSILKKINALFV